MYVNTNRDQDDLPCIYIKFRTETVKFEVNGRNNGFLEFIHSFVHSIIRSFSQKFKLGQPSDSGNRVFFIIYFWTKY